MIKYKTENEMCKDITTLIGGLLIGLCEFQYIPEVPRFSHNNHFDMLLIDRTNRQVLAIEYKLSDINSLINQCWRGSINKMGIINRQLKPNKHLEKVKIFSFIGFDNEIEIINEHLLSHWSWTKVFGNPLANVYWYGYIDKISSLDGGFKNGDRISFFQLYKTAIKNLQIMSDWKLNFDIIYEILGSYSISIALKYFKEVTKERI